MVEGLASERTERKIDATCLKATLGRADHQTAGRHGREGLPYEGLQDRRAGQPRYRGRSTYGLSAGFRTDDRRPGILHRLVPESIERQKISPLNPCRKPGGKAVRDDRRRYRRYNRAEIKFSRLKGW